MNKALSHKLRSDGRVDFVFLGTNIDVISFGMLSVSYDLLPF